MSRAARPALVALLLVLVACAGTLPPAVNPTTAATYSAELTAAQVDHDTTMREAEAARVAGRLTGAPLERVRAAGRELDAAMRRAHAELQVYLVAGVESEAFRAAWTAMATARTNLALTWQAVKR